MSTLQAEEGGLLDEDQANRVAISAARSIRKKVDRFNGPDHMCTADLELTIYRWLLEHVMEFMVEVTK